MKAEFDYQWKNIPSELTEYNEDRVNELLRFTELPREFFNKKVTLDAGCGNGRYTHAMKELGAIVGSIDVSIEAVNKCKEINPHTRQVSIMGLAKVPLFDFVFSFGVLHHMEDSHAGFKKLVAVLRYGGTLHLMLYHNKTQKRYRKLREKFKTLNREEKLDMCHTLARKPEHIHGWYDALNPEYNHSYETTEIVKWYEDAGFKNIKVMNTSNININGQL